MAALTPQAFAKRWGESTLSERSSYQQHFLDLCGMLDAQKPAETDPVGDFYTFEKGVEKTGGGKGFADVWYWGRFAIEYKGKHKNLSAAYQQLLQYREALENPPVLVVTDIERFEIHTNFTGTVTRVYGFTNSELPEPENLRLLRAMFDDPYSLKPTRTVESVTEEAAPLTGSRALGAENGYISRRRQRSAVHTYDYLCDVPATVAARRGAGGRSGSAGDLGRSTMSRRAAPQLARA